MVKRFVRNPAINDINKNCFTFKIAESSKRRLYGNEGMKNAVCPDPKPAASLGYQPAEDALLQQCK